VRREASDWRTLSRHSRHWRRRSPSAS
jgi:hypothetical protein